jgi:hypothetical protein
MMPSLAQPTVNLSDASRANALAHPDRVGDNYPVMCGRYASFLPAEALARIFGTRNPLPNLAPSWNIAPTQDSAVVRRHHRSAPP